MEPELLSHIVLLEIIIKPLSFGFFAGIIALLFLLLSSALISGSEVAFFSLTPKEIADINSSNKKSNIIISGLLKKPQKLLATILIANNFINIGIVIISAFVIDSVFDFTGSQMMGFLIQVVAITFVLLLFGEIIPKVFAANSGPSFAYRTALPIFLSQKLFSPVSWLLIRSTAIVDKKLNKNQKNISVEELSHAFELTETDISEGKKILEGIVNFGNIQVKEIMKPRVDVVTADVSFGFNKLLSLIVESGYSRIPVFEDTPDNIKGVIYIKDLLPHIGKSDDYKWQNLLRDPYFVPETMKIDDLLEEIKVKKIHMAIITDEYGGILGIATLEDVLEEIVGEISDESDELDDNFEKIDENNYIFEGKIQLNDFYKITKLDDNIFEEVRGDADSLAGVILELRGEIPKKNDIIKYKNFIFDIHSADSRKIKKIKFEILQKKK